MPEFVLDHGTADAQAQFRALDSFTQGYIEAMFFTETGSPDDTEDDLMDVYFYELAPEALARIVADCAKFQEANAQALTVALENPDRQNRHPTEEHLGRDFWYTRNGHGCGYWDGDWPEDAATPLTDAAHSWGEVYMYRGDDGLIYTDR